MAEIKEEMVRLVYKWVKHVRVNGWGIGPLEAAEDIVQELWRRGYYGSSNEGAARLKLG